jgi:hypothetical protein
MLALKLKQMEAQSRARQSQREAVKRAAEAAAAILGKPSRAQRTSPSSAAWVESQASTSRPQAVSSPLLVLGSPNTPSTSNSSGQYRHLTQAMHSPHRERYNSSAESSLVTTPTSELVSFKQPTVIDMCALFFFIIRYIYSRCGAMPYGATSRYGTGTETNGTAVSREHRETDTRACVRLTRWFA